MTWYSRLLQNERKSSLRASRRRRQAIDLERLEARTVLSNVSVTFPAPAPFPPSTLLITGDTGNDNIVIQENNDGSVTVLPGPTQTKVQTNPPGVIVVPGSTLNGNAAPVNTNNPVAGIVVQLPGTTNFDFVTLDGQSTLASPTVGPVTVTATGANLTFGVGVAGAAPLTGIGVHNNGALTVSDLASLPSNGVLNATVVNSSFTSMSITQLGNGPDISTATLTNDNAPASVFVSLGNANGDKITVSTTGTNQTVFGPTTLEEGQGNNGQPVTGPAVGTSSGNNDSISVTGPAAPGFAHFTNLRALQDVTLNAATPSPFGGGTGETININQIQVASISATSPNPAGVTTSQGNGAHDTTTVNLVNTYTVPGFPPVNLPLPPGVGYASINVLQGTGANGLPAPNGVPAAAVNDSATVSNSGTATAPIPGFISITQADVASNSPSYNSATILNDFAGGSALTASPLTPAGSALNIKQGDAGTIIVKGVLQGPGDTALIRNSTAKAGNATITQGNGINDSATIDPSTIAGNATIVQGSGAADTAQILNDTIGGSASITQADVATNPFGDTARINGDTVTGNDTISQGDAAGDVATVVGGSAGGNVTVTQGNGAGDLAAVNLTKVGGNVTVSQGDGNNDVATVLGAAVVPTTGTVGGNVTVTQGNGNSDTAVVAYLTIGTVNTGNGNILIAQGNGNNDAAEIENVTDPGGTTKAPITIGITQGNGNNDIAAIVNLTANGVLLPGNPPPPYNIFITQGSGNADWAEIGNVNAPSGNVLISQNDLATNTLGDTALVLFTNVGTTTTNPDGSVNDVAGQVTINQGSAPGDIALVAGGIVNGVDVPGTANNVTITQGSNGAANGSLVSFNGSNIYADIAEINDETVTSNITITQGNSNSFGYNVTAIGFDYLGLASGLVPTPTPPAQFTPLVTVPTGGASPVTAGGVTAIQQFGANNQVFLGSASSYFYTTFLDVYTGAGGGAFVMVQNTYTFGAAALGGPFSSVYNIEGGGTGNAIYLDAISVFYVTWDPANFIYIG